MSTRDYRSEPFRRMVILGESTVQGGPWLSEEENKWADIVKHLIDTCQAAHVEYYNEGIGASVISPKSAEYEASNKPSAIERYKERVISANPDLFIIAYGLNDMRAGTDLLTFKEELETIVQDVKAACNPLTVLVNLYYVTGFDRYPPFNKGTIDASIAYNRIIAEVAHDNDCLYADIWSVMNGADWLVHGDGVHSNATGNIVIANKVFEVLAGYCSCLSRKTNEHHIDSEWTRVAESMAYAQIEPLEHE